MGFWRYWIQELITDMPRNRLPKWLSGKESTCQCRSDALDLWVGKIPWRRKRKPTPVFLGFPGGADSKESACSAEDLGSIPGWEDPMEEDMETYSSILGGRIPMDRGAWWATVHRVSKS